MAKYLNFQVQFGPSLNFKAGNAVTSNENKFGIPALFYNAF